MPLHTPLLCIPDFHSRILIAYHLVNRRRSSIGKCVHEMLPAGIVFRFRRVYERTTAERDVHVFVLLESEFLNDSNQIAVVFGRSDVKHAVNGKRKPAVVIAILVIPPPYLFRCQIDVAYFPSPLVIDTHARVYDQAPLFQLSQCHYPNTSLKTDTVGERIGNADHKSSKKPISIISHIKSYVNCFFL